MKRMMFGLLAAAVMGFMATSAQADIAPFEGTTGTYDGIVVTLNPSGDTGDFIGGFLANEAIGSEADEMAFVEALTGDDLSSFDKTNFGGDNLSETIDIPLGATYVLVKDGTAGTGGHLYTLYTVVSSPQTGETIQLLDSEGNPVSQGAVSHATIFFDGVAVPTPGMLALLGTGLAGVLAFRRRFNK